MLKRNQRIRAFVRWGQQCVYCSKNLLRTPTSFSGYSIDHLIPEDDDGANDVENTLPACSVCNMLKGNYKLHYQSIPTQEVTRGSKKKKIIQSSNDRKKAISAARAYVLKRKDERKSDLQKFKDDIDQQKSDPVATGQRR